MCDEELNSMVRKRCYIERSNIISSMIAYLDFGVYQHLCGLSGSSGKQNIRKPLADENKRATKQ